MYVQPKADQSHDGSIQQFLIPFEIDKDALHRSFSNHKLFAISLQWIVVIFSLYYVWMEYPNIEMLSRTCEVLWTTQESESSKKGIWTVSGDAKNFKTSVRQGDLVICSGHGM